MRTALRDTVAKGRLIVQYNGHGAMQYWAGEKLLQLSDLSLFSNADKLAFLMPMTCMEGYFIWPGAQSVGGSIVRLENGGAVASWSPTGYGFAIGHVMLSSNFLNNLFNNFHNQIGYLTTQAKYELFTQTSNFRDLIDTFVLFGDPALRLKTIPVQLEAPSNLVATASSNHQIDLSWTDNSVNETAFLIERSPNGTGDWEQIADVGPNQTTYSDIGLQVSSTYHYRVRAYRIGDGTYSEYSNEDDATIESLLFFYLPLIVNSTP